MELCMRENTVFFLPVNILIVWHAGFLGHRHTTVCLDIFDLCSNLSEAFCVTLKTCLYT